jgi:hypothetical protein
MLFSGGAQFVAHRGQEVALHLVHFEQPHVHLGQLVDLAVEFVVDAAQLVLLTQQLTEHSIERGAKFLELVARVDDGPLFDVAAANRVGHFAEMRQRLDDNVPNDHIQRRHRQEDGDDAEGDQQRAILRLGVLRVFGVHRHAEDGHQVALFQVGQHQLIDAPFLLVTADAAFLGEDGLVVNVRPAAAGRAFVPKLVVGVLQRLINPGVVERALGAHLIREHGPFVHPLELELLVGALRLGRVARIASFPGDLAAPKQFRQRFVGLLI